VVTGVQLACKFMKSTKKSVNLYSQSMQIEENFRDTKNNKLGMREIIDDDRYFIPLEEYIYVLSELSNLTVNMEGLHE